ncbi:hypothetical protein ACFQL4_14805 [Halosimplex aquaticum]
MTPTDGTLRHSDKSLVYDALSSSRRRDVVRLLDDAEAGCVSGTSRRRSRNGNWRTAPTTNRSNACRRRCITSTSRNSPTRASSATGRSDQVRLTQAVTFDAIDVLGE